MVTLTAPEIRITKKGAQDGVKVRLEIIVRATPTEKVAPFDLDEYLAGKSRTWTAWDCDPSEFPWEYSQVEYAYVIAGQFLVTYEGGEPVEINAGDFVRFPVGKTQFKVTVPVRKFFTLVQE